MGLTVGCAVCHDHKFDPISQKEFYRLYAFFNNSADAAMDGNALLPKPILRLPTADQRQQQDSLKRQVTGVQDRIRTELAKVDGEGASRRDANMRGVSRRDATTGDPLAAWEEKKRADRGAGLPEPVKGAVLTDRGKRTLEQRKQIRDYYLEHVDAKTRPVFDPLHRQLDALSKKLADLEAAIPATMVVEELNPPRDAFVLKRGEYDKRGEKVTRGVPAALPPLPQGAPLNRLGLAKWLVDPSHPLTARVTVNRFWQHCFGTGIVKTAEDFGAQGELPSHPELLDWLATEFVSSGWNVKQLQKLIVTSAAYRQSSRVTPRLLERDPENRLLARAHGFAWTPRWSATTPWR